MEPIEDSRWHSVAGLRPRLRGHVRMQRRVTRGRTWYLLCDDARRRYLRVDETAWQFVGRLDGSTSVDELWRRVHLELAEAAPSQGEVLQILSQLSTAELLTHHRLLDPAQLISTRRSRQRRIAAATANPLAFKVALFDPTRLLHALMPLARHLFTPWAALAWLALAAWAASAAHGHWDQLLHALTSEGRTAQFLILVWVAYPFVKALHEACHAMAVRVWGGEVREVGVMLLMLSPLPYVDASSASGFASRRRRVMVSAVGIMAEIAVASVALLLWASSNDAGLRQVTLAVVAGCGLSTLMFNANPLARFDGYHMLCDLIDMPNLAQRARAVLAHGVQRLLGAADVSRSESSNAEVAGLALYGLSSWLYQVLAVLAMTWWLSAPYPLLAWIVGAVGLVGLCGPAGLSLLRFLLLDGRLKHRRLRALGLTGGTVAAAAALLWMVPTPSFTVQHGVVWTPSEAIVRAEDDGELRDLASRDGERVTKGQLIARLENLALLGERATKASRLQELDVQYYDAMVGKPTEIHRIALERDSVRGALARLDERLASLTLRARLDGTLLVPRDSAQDGHFYRQGRELAYILPNGPGLLLKVALTEAQAALVRGGTTAVSVMLSDGSHRPLRATVRRETPEVTRTLPSAVLGSSAGGAILVDPNDSDGRLALAPVTVVDVWVPDAPARWIGARALVRFDHPSEPLARQWARSMRQAFLSRLALPTSP